MSTPSSSSLLCTRWAFLLILAALVISTVCVRAQLAWSNFDETSSSTLSATATVSATLTNSQQATLVSTNIVPIDLSAAGSSATITLNITTTGGLSNIASGTRAIGLGLFNHASTSTATNFAADTGYFFWVNGRSTGSNLIEQRKKLVGTTPSLLSPNSVLFGALGTGVGIQTAGSLSDNTTYTVTLRLVRTSTGISLGTSTSTANAGIWINGTNFSQTTYSSVDSSPGSTTFNELAVYFYNTSGSNATITVGGVTDVTPINPPAIATQPAALSVTPSQSRSLTVLA